jgi:hypothetical protein
MAAMSPTPNHRIEMGIQASGEIGRKIWINGFNAISDRRYHPIANPSGIPNTAAAVKPQVTRNSEAVTYFNNKPRRASSTRGHSDRPRQEMDSLSRDGDMPQYKQSRDECDGA